jgi:DNA-binding transcriptional LysR family regulator
VKKRTEPDWTDLRTFAALARHGTLSSTARVLKLNHATISRRLSSLEAALNTRLMERRPHRYLLTAEGQKILDVVARMERASLELTAFKGGSPRGKVRITASPSIGDGFIASRLAPIRDRFPSLDIELAWGLRTLSLARYEADLGIRIGRLADSELVARKLPSLSFALYANEGWATRLDKGEPPEFISFDEANAHLAEAQLLAATFENCRLTFQASSQWTQARAAADGFGVALLPKFVGCQFKELRPVLPNVKLPRRELWLVCPREDHALWPIGQVREFLLEMFTRNRALFEN